MILCLPVMSNSTLCLNTFNTAYGPIHLLPLSLSFSPTLVTGFFNLTWSSSAHMTCYFWLSPAFKHAFSASRCTSFWEIFHAWSSSLVNCPAGHHWITSDGNLGFMPYKSLKGDSFTVLCQLVRWANRATGRYTSQSVCIASQYADYIWHNEALNRSVSPLHLGL